MATDYEHDSGPSMDLQVAAVKSLPADMAIMRMENENIMSLAAARPRDHAKIKNEIVAQLEAYPSFAAAAIYSKPVGRENDKCTQCGSELYRKNGQRAERCFKCGSTDIEEGKMKYARNLSVRAAEAIAEAYGYNRVRCDVIPVDNDTVKVEATFTDYQKGRIWQAAAMVSKFFRKRNGQMERIPDDRFYNVVVKAEQSRCIREAITRSVPPGLRSELFDMAEKRLATLLDDPTVNKILAKFATRGVTLEQIEKRIGRTRAMGWTEQDRLDLLGVWNALEDGETTVAEAFGDLEPAQQPKTNGTPKPASGGASINDLTRKPPQQTTHQPENSEPTQAEKQTTGATKEDASNSDAEPDFESESLVEQYSLMIADAATEADVDNLAEDAKSKLTGKHLATVNRMAAAKRQAFAKQAKPGGRQKTLLGGRQSATEAGH